MVCIAHVYDCSRLDDGLALIASVGGWNQIPRRQQLCLRGKRSEGQWGERCVRQNKSQDPTYSKRINPDPCLCSFQGQGCGVKLRTCVEVVIRRNVCLPCDTDSILDLGLYLVKSNIGKNQDLHQTWIIPGGLGQDMKGMGATLLSKPLTTTKFM